MSDLIAPEGDDQLAIEQLVNMLDDIRYEKAQLAEREGILHRKLLELIQPGEAVIAERGRVTVSTRKTFNANLAEKLLAESDLSDELKERCLKRVVDRKALAAIAPELEEQAVSESLPFVSYREAR